VPANSEHSRKKGCAAEPGERDVLLDRLANAFEEAIAAVENGEHLLWLLKTKE